MSASINRVTLIGNLGQRPECVDKNQRIAVFSIATNESYQDKHGEWQKITEWFKVKAHGPLADRVVRNFKKGQLAYVEGKFKSYQNKSGVTHWEVVALTCKSFEKPPPAPFHDPSQPLGPEPIDTYPKTPWGNPKQ